MTLRDAIERCVQSPANTNQTGLTLSQTHGWRVTYGREDQDPGDIGIISKESLTEWLDLGEWTDETFDQCAEWISDNLGDWLYQLWDRDRLTDKQVADLLIASNRTE